MKAHEATNPRYVALLALVAGAILLIGVQMKPSPDNDEPSPSSSQAERPRLERLTQRASLENMMGYFGQIASEVSPHVVRITDTQSSGVVWGSDGLVVTPSMAWRFPESVELVGGSNGTVAGVAETIGAPPHLPVATIRPLDELTLPPVPRLPIIVPPIGEWIIAVWRPPDRDFAFSPGILVGIEPAECEDFRIKKEIVSNIPLRSNMAGGGLFNQNGRLLGVIVPCGDRYAVMSVETTAEMLQEKQSFTGRLLTRWGMRVESLHSAAQKYFRAEQGALVAEVWKGYAADLAGLVPGDVILRLDEEEIVGPADLEALALPPKTETFDLEVLRQRKKVKLSLHARPQDAKLNDDVEVAGVVLAAREKGYRIESVLPGSLAQEAGIEPGDRLMRIDHATPTNPAQVHQTLGVRSEQPRFLVLERGPKRWGIFLH